MTSDYTPTEEAMRTSWRNEQSRRNAFKGKEFHQSDAELNAEFDRFLANVRAKAFDEGTEAAAMQVPEGVWHDLVGQLPPNPYRATSLRAGEEVEG